MKRILTTAVRTITAASGRKGRCRLLQNASDLAESARHENRWFIWERSAKWTRSSVNPDFAARFMVLPVARRYWDSIMLRSVSRARSLRFRIDSTDGVCGW
jgi:hypothetical protein